jgi:uncharacterized membrane protein required for colicin V production
MTALDIIVLLLVGLGVFTGLRKGFVHAVLSLGVWVLVVLALWALHGVVGRGSAASWAPRPAAMCSPSSSFSRGLGSAERSW